MAATAIATVAVTRLKRPRCRLRTARTSINRLPASSWYPAPTEAADGAGLCFWTIGWDVGNVRDEGRGMGDVGTAHRTDSGVPFPLPPSLIPRPPLERQVVILIGKRVREVLEILAAGGWRLGLRRRGSSATR